MYGYFHKLNQLEKIRKETKAQRNKSHARAIFRWLTIVLWIHWSLESKERIWSIRTDGQCQEEIKKLVHHLRLLMFDLRNIKIIWEIILSFEGGVEGAIDKEFKYVKNTGVLTAILVRRDVLSTVKICRACLFVCVVLVMFKALFGMFIKHFSRWFYNWNISVTKTARNLQFGQRFVRWSFT